jgi:hypothetical protein
MSHYPPPPSFGVPFNGNGHFAPSQNAPYPAVSNFIYYQSPDANNQGRAPPPVSYANVYPFSGTSQNMNLPLSRAGMPQVPYATFGQTTSASFPPPPYPSTQPIPYSAFPPPHLPPQQLLQHEVHSASIQAHVSLPVKPPPVASSFIQVTSEDPQTSIATVTELEDGELSDGDRGGESGGALDLAASNGSRPPNHKNEEISRSNENPDVGKDIGAQESILPRAKEGI